MQTHKHSPTSSHLEESREHVECVNGRGTVRVGQHLVDVATPGILLIVIGDGLEGGQDGREERRGGRRGLDLWEAFRLAVILTTEHTGSTKALNAKRTFTALTNCQNNLFFRFNKY